MDIENLQQKNDKFDRHQIFFAISRIEQAKKSAYHKLLSVTNLTMYFSNTNLLNTYTFGSGDNILHTLW